VSKEWEEVSFDSLAEQAGTHFGSNLTSYFEEPVRPEYCEVLSERAAAFAVDGVPTRLELAGALAIDLGGDAPNNRS
jgi:hypothetical protein